MKLSTFKAGTLRSGYNYNYFLPNPINHTFEIDSQELISLIEIASMKLGELNSFTKFVADSHIFIQSLVAKEAVTSSAIEGTKTNIEEALTDITEINAEKRDDWLEVQQYIKAMNTSIESLTDLPLSNRLIKKAHKILLTSTRGKNKLPGTFRTSQNWIGGATLNDAIFIPPHHDHLPDLMSDLEKFLTTHDIRDSHLIKIGIAHYQFETIHPFLDGNGRVGRLLITLYLVSQKLLDKPVLYLSDFFEKNRPYYYDNLMRAREKNDLHQWLKFFLIGIIETANNTIAVLQQMIALKEDIIQNRLQKLGRKLTVSQILLDALFKTPVTSSKKVQIITQLSAKASNDLLNNFLDQKIIIEVTGNKRNRIFIFKEYLDILQK